MPGICQDLYCAVSLSQIQFSNFNMAHTIIMLCGRRDHQSEFIKQKKLATVGKMKECRWGHYWFWRKKKCPSRRIVINTGLVKIEHGMFQNRPPTPRWRTGGRGAWSWSKPGVQAPVKYQFVVSVVSLTVTFIKRRNKQRRLFSV